MLAAPITPGRVNTARSLIQFPQTIILCEITTGLSDEQVVLTQGRG